MLWLCLYFPNLPLETFTAHHNSGGSEPQIIDLGKVIADQQRVWLADKTARAQGITPGMSMATAYALQDELMVIQRSPQKELQTLEQIAQWAYQITPAVSMQGEHHLLLEVGSVMRLFKNLNNILRRIDEGMQQLGFSYQLGLAHTPKAALLVAKHLPSQHQRYYNSKTQRVDKPTFKQLLNNMPLISLDCPAAQIEKLHRIGLKTIGELMDLPVHALGKRFGKDFLKYLAQLRGEQTDPQPYITPTSHFEQSLFFDDVVYSVQALQTPLARLLSQLCDFLHYRQLDSLYVSWQLSGNGYQTTIPIALSQPVHSLQILQELTATAFEHIKLEKPIDTLSLQCVQLSKRAPHNNDLFDNHDHTEQLTGHLFDKLRTKFGRERVSFLQSKPEHLPEKAMATLSHSNPTHSKPSKAKPERGEAPRPLWLLQKPELIKQYGKDLYWRGKMTVLQGPERIEAHWQPKAQKRDYFIARHENGGVYWVFHDRMQNHWYTHGVFA